jgi:transposase
MSSSMNWTYRVWASRRKPTTQGVQRITRAKMKRRIAEVDASIDRYLQLLAETDRNEPTEDKSQRLEDKIAALKKEMARLKSRSPDAQSAGPADLTD